MITRRNLLKAGVVGATTTLLPRLTVAKSHDTLSTGVPQIDELLGGGIRSGLTVITGTRQSGKTTLIHKIARSNFMNKEIGLIDNFGKTYCFRKEVIDKFLRIKKYVIISINSSIIPSTDFEKSYYNVLYPRATDIIHLDYYNKYTATTMSFGKLMKSCQWFPGLWYANENSPKWWNTQ